MRTHALMIALISLVVGPGRALAQLAVDPAPSGVYEGYSPTTRAPYGPLKGGPVASLSQWVEVRTRGRMSTLAFMPDGERVWRLRYGPMASRRRR